jgi:hypothetical protein
LVPIIVLFAGVSCDHEPEFVPSPEPGRPVLPATNSFDASTAGRVFGSVGWTGEKPAPPPFLFGVPAADGNFTMKMIPNPNAPTINEKNVAGAVVFLRGIDPSRAKPWDLPPVRVEMKDRNIRVIQGDAAGRVGFVRRGDAVEMKSAEPVYHVLRTRGASFFSLTFPQPEQPLSRTFDKAGRVELSSGSGFYWASADLFVTDHPYWARTDSKGSFEFENVPPGSYEVVAWLPGWDVAKQERDPETGLIFRQTYAKPLEASHTVKLDAKGLAVASLSISK